MTAPYAWLVAEILRAERLAREPTGTPPPEAPKPVAAPLAPITINITLQLPPRDP